MSIGSVLLQPQRLERARRLPAESALGDDIVNVIARIAFEPAQAEPLLTALEQAFVAMGERLHANAGAGFETGVARLLALVQPLLDDVDAFAANPPALDAPEDFFALLLDLLDALIGLLESLDANALRAQATVILDVIESDFGLSAGYLEAQLWQTVDDVVARLRAVPATPEGNATRLALIALLGRCKRTLQGTLELPSLTADDLVQLLLDGLHEAGLDVFIDKARCIVQALRDVLSSTSALGELTATFGVGSAGAGEVRSPEGGDEYCWYASWLMRTEGRPTIGFGSVGEFFAGLGWTVLGKLPGFPYDEVWVTADRTQLVRRNVFRADEILHEGTNIEWHQAPVFSGTARPHFTFTSTLDHDFMEGWARYSAAVPDFVKWILHFTEIALEDQDVASNAFHMFWNFTNGPVKLGTRKPMLSLMNAAMGAPQALRWVWNLFPIGITMLAALENQHKVAEKSTGAMYATLLAEDALEAITYDAALEALRDLSLSLFTLINYRGAAYAPDVGADDRPLNRIYCDPFISLASLGTAWLLTAIIPREDYSYPFDDENKGMYGWWMVGGTLAGAVGAMLGTGIGTFGIGRASDGPLLGKNVAAGAFAGFFTFWVSLYSFCEGKTGGGTYNPRGEEFEGYPDHENSPYRLPYALDTSQFCDQGNQGMWSHNDKAGTAQVYAYDFAHDQDELVVAARDGTVVDYFDWVTNDTDPEDDERVQIRKQANASGVLIDGQTGFVEVTADDIAEGITTVEQKIDEKELKSPSWNFVLIRHDNPFGTETEAQRADHDKAVAGQRVVTYAVYGHGRTDGVRNVLTEATPNDDPTEIIGLQIRRGQPLMRAGNTGNSFHNHLHMDVRTDNSAPPADPDPYPDPPVKLDAMRNFTIPFVFGDVTNPFSMDGRPFALNHYTSGNALETP